MTELLTVKETAAYLRTSLQQVRQMIREGDLFAVKVGREYRIPLSALVEFLEDPEKGGTLAHFCREPEDREVGLAVGQAVLDRAARLLCANLAAVLQFVGAGRDPKAPACVGLHGAAFAFPPVKSALEHWAQADLREGRGLSLTLWQGEDMLTTGAAAAALYQG